jgi:squalene cyclase
MAKIDNVLAKMGRLVHIENTNQNNKGNESDVYVAVWVEDADGSNRRCIMFTDGEIARAERRAVKNPEDQVSLDRSWIQKLFNL